MCQQVIIVVKVIVVYESKYENTKRVAEAIKEGMSEISDVESLISELKKSTLTRSLIMMRF